jgi:TolB-like protein/DNA-binding winged helix-turn-helix (wHTH) protein
MERPATKSFRIGDWRIDPAAGQISRDGETARLEARTMGLLLCLAEHAGEVVSIDDLLSQVWAGVTVSQDSVYQAVTSLRRLLGDDPKQPTYIATVPRLGYRLVAPVGPWSEVQVKSLSLRSPEESIAQTSAGITAESESAVSTPASGPRMKYGVLWTIGAVLCLVLGVGFMLFRGKVDHGDRSAAAAVVPVPQKSIAVLPFLDLTEGMKEEEFADGMTEELIDKLSHVPGLRVPAPTSSFYYKGKQVPVADIARTLGVVYVLDGSVRKSGTRLRVAARLVRADNGYVIWSETYDRPFADVLMIQDDIAGEVTKALQASIEGENGAR